MKRLGLMLGASLMALGLLADGTCTYANLLHRWSFTSDASDSVGGTTASLYGSAEVQDGKLVLLGGNKGSSYANLGAGMVPTSGAFTIELWAKKTAVSSFGRIFDIGTGNNNYIFMAWNRASTANTDQLGYWYTLNQLSFKGNADDRLAYDLNVFYHIAISYEPQADNTTLISFWRRNLLTGVVEKSATLTSAAGWTPSLLTEKATFWLGHSQWGEPDSASQYDEVRVWNTALTEEQLTWSARLGPDTLPTDPDANPPALLTVQGDSQGDVRIDAGAAGLSATTNSPLRVFTTNTVTAVAKPGFRFKEWTGDLDVIAVGTTIDSTLKVISARSATLTASFQPAIATWSGLGADGQWSTAENWVKYEPAEGGEATFGATTRTAMVNDLVGSLGRMNFTDVAPSYTLAGYDLQLVNLVNESTATQKFQVAVSAPTGLTVANAGTLVFEKPAQVKSIAASGAGTLMFKDGVTCDSTEAFTLTGGNMVLEGDSTGNKLHLANGQTHVQLADGASLKLQGNDAALDVSQAGTGNHVFDIGDATISTFHHLVGRVGTGTINQNAGNVTATGWFVAGINGNGTYNLNGGLLKTTAANNGNHPNILGETKSGVGVLNVREGAQMETAHSFDVGRSGKGTVNQTGGSVTVGKDLVLARDAGSSGTYSISAGSLAATSGWIYLGNASAGTMNITGTGEVRTRMVRFGNAGNEAVSTLNLRDAGVLKAEQFYSNYRWSHSSINIDGGTIRAWGSGQTYPNFFDGIERINVGSRGFTFDTGDNTVVLAEPLVTKGGEGVVTKVGSGTLRVPAESGNIGGLKVQEGKVVAMQAIPMVSSVGTRAATVPHLLHRWSFTDGSLADSVTGALAVQEGTVNYTNGCACLPGGNAGTGYLDLGANLLPTDGRGFTIEIFATHRSVKNWARIFDFGAKGSNYRNYDCYMSWVQGTNPNADKVEGKFGGQILFTRENAVQPYSLNVPYHIALVFRPNVDGNGKPGYYYTKTILDGTGQTYSGFALGSYACKVADMRQERFWLGHSAWGENDSNADYDEVRIWDTTLTPEQLRFNAMLGADTLPALGASGLVHRWSFNGTLEDSVGGVTAQVGGTQPNGVVWNDAENPTAISLPGNGTNTGYVELGKSVVPLNGEPVTIELWATKVADRGWARLVELGTGANADYLYMAWTGSGGRVEYKNAGVVEIQKDNTMGFENGKRYHIAMTVVRDADGRSTVKWSSRDDAGVVQKSGSATTVDVKTFAETAFAKGSLYLGHTAFTGWKDADACATYDEVRVWRGALTDAQLVANAKLGPDALPTTVEYAEQVQSANPMDDVDLGDNGTFAWEAPLTLGTVRGTGTLDGSEAADGTGVLTVTNALDVAKTATGTMTVEGAVALTGTWTLDVGEEATSDRLVGTGSIDFTGSVLEVRDPELLTDECYVLVNGPRVIGAPSYSNTRYTVKAKPNRLLLLRQHTIIYLR